MRRLIVLCGLLFASLAIGWTGAGHLDAQDVTPPQAPVFRAGVNLIEMDVSVLDPNRRPVKGLTAADFTVLDDGQPKKVVAFSSIDVPDAEPQSTISMRKTAGDVATNQFADRRLVVILISDLLLNPLDWGSCDGPGLASNEMTQQLAHTIVHNLGPADLASVEYVYHRALGQPFTQDQAKLDEAVDRFEPLVVGCIDALRGVRRGDFSDAAVASGLPAQRDLVGALNRTINALGSVPDRRKLVFLIGDGNDLDTGASGRDQLYRAAQRANVTLNSLDPDGLVAPDTMNPTRPGALDPHRAARENVVETALNTGGEAVVNTNDPASEVPGIFRENESYYLLAFEADPGAKAGLSRRVEVKVNRPDVEVLARHGYYTSGPGASTASSAPAATNPFAGPLPSVSFPLEVVVAPFAGVAHPVPTAEIALHVTEPGVAWSRNEVLQIEARAYSADGDEEQSHSYTVRWAPQSGTTGDREGTTVLHMDLSPGYHELRVAVRGAALGTTASVFADVDVPDFVREPVSLSGLVIAVGATDAGSAGAQPSPMAVVPTTSRAFTTSDRVSASLSLYQGGRGPVVPVTMTTLLRNARDQMAFTHSEIVAPDRFITSNRRADWAIDLPLSSLAPGTYLLTIEAVAGAQRAQREVTFRVR
jgi:VWFA-related protein